MPDVKIVGCDHCDFGFGQRGMDRCVKCDGTGSQFQVGVQRFPNTSQGYSDASDAVRKTMEAPDA